MFCRISTIFYSITLETAGGPTHNQISTSVQREPPELSLKKKKAIVSPGTISLYWNMLSLDKFCFRTGFCWFWYSTWNHLGYSLRIYWNKIVFLVRTGASPQVPPLEDFTTIQICCFVYELCVYTHGSKGKSNCVQIYRYRFLLRKDSQWLYLRCPPIS